MLNRENEAIERCQVPFSEEENSTRGPHSKDLMKDFKDYPHLMQHINREEPIIPPDFPENAIYSPNSEPSTPPLIERSENEIHSRFRILDDSTMA
jgi:hypothetical protein